jgi:hypothetical protein
MNDEGMSVDMGVVSDFNVSTAYDKDKGLVCTIKYKANLDASDIARMLDAGKTTSLRAKIFTQVLPVLPDRQGDQLGLGCAAPEPTVAGTPVGVGKETATATLEAALEASGTAEALGEAGTAASPPTEPTAEIHPFSKGEPDWSKPHAYMRSWGEGARRGYCRCGEKKSHAIHTDTGLMADG